MLTLAGGSDFQGQLTAAILYRCLGYSGHSRLIRIGDFGITTGSNRNGHIGADALIQVVRGHIGSIIVCIAVAVVLIAGLHGLDSDGDAADSHFLVLVARIFVHLGAELDGLGIILRVRGHKAHRRRWSYHKHRW